MAQPASQLQIDEIDSDDDQSPTEVLEIDERYTVVPDVDGSSYWKRHDAFADMNWSPRQGLAALVDPFLDRVYPLNRENDLPEGTIHKDPYWQAIHHPDGSGVVQSSAGSRLYGIRTADGTVVATNTNRLWFPYHSEYHRRRDDDSGEVDRYDYEWFVQMPFRFVGEVLTEFTDLDLAAEDSLLRMGMNRETMVEGPEFMRGVVGADTLDDDTEDGVLLTHETGVQVYVGWDSTAWDDYEMFGFVPFDGEAGVPVPSAEDALDLLTPNAAAAGDDSEVIRQGEYFLVPFEAEPEGTIQSPGVSERPFGGSPLDSHIPREWRTAVADDVFVQRFVLEFGDELDVSDVETPQDAVDLLYEHEGGLKGEAAMATSPLAAPYATARELAESIYVRGSFRHRDNEHRMEMVEEWRRVTTHEWDVMTQDGQRYHME
jgi:hypothetical protein